VSKKSPKLAKTHDLYVSTLFKLNLDVCGDAEIEGVDVMSSIYTHQNRKLEEAVCDG